LAQLDLSQFDPTAAEETLNKTVHSKSAYDVDTSRRDERIIDLGKSSLLENGFKVWKIRMRLLPYLKDGRTLGSLAGGEFHQDGSVCPRTFKQDCAWCQSGWDLYNEAKAAAFASGITDDDKLKQIAGAERKAHSTNKRFFVNALIIDDAGNPENNGKIFVFSFGQNVADLLYNKQNPDQALIDAGQATPFNAFSISNGRDFFFYRTIPDRNGGWRDSDVSKSFFFDEAQSKQFVAPNADTETKKAAYAKIFENVLDLDKEFIDPENCHKTETEQLEAFHKALNKKDETANTEIQKTQAAPQNQSQSQTVGAEDLAAQMQKEIEQAFATPTPSAVPETVQPDTTPTPSAISETTKTPTPSAVNADNFFDV